jgi:hypothetical protein
MTHVFLLVDFQFYFHELSMVQANIRSFTAVKIRTVVQLAVILWSLVSLCHRFGGTHSLAEDGVNMHFRNFPSLL